MKNRLLSFKLFLLVFSVLSIYANAQVTIGSLINPVKGSVLDIKQQEPDQNNVTAKAGFLLPRVELKNVNELIFGDFSIADTDDGGGQKLKHVGLLVYNMSEIDPFKKGVYCWNGEEWIYQQ